MQLTELCIPNSEWRSSSSKGRRERGGWWGRRKEKKDGILPTTQGTVSTTSPRMQTPTRNIDFGNCDVVKQCVAWHGETTTVCPRRASIPSRAAGWCGFVPTGDIVEGILKKGIQGHPQQITKEIADAGAFKTETCCRQSISPRHRSWRKS